LGALNLQKVEQFDQSRDPHTLLHNWQKSLKNSKKNSKKINQQKVLEREN